MLKTLESQAAEAMQALQPFSGMPVPNVFQGSARDGDAGRESCSCLWLSKTIAFGFHARLWVFTNRGAYAAIVTMSDFRSRPVMKPASPIAAYIQQSKSLLEADVSVASVIET